MVYQASDYEEEEEEVDGEVEFSSGYLRRSKVRALPSTPLLEYDHLRCVAREKKQKPWR